MSEDVYVPCGLAPGAHKTLCLRLLRLSLSEDRNTGEGQRGINQNTRDLPKQRSFTSKAPDTFGDRASWLLQYWPAIVEPGLLFVDPSTISSPTPGSCLEVLGAAMDIGGAGGERRSGAKRYRRAIAGAESASEADRDILVEYHDSDIRTGAILDELLGELRNHLALIEERLSNPLPSAKENEDCRLAKMLAGTRAAQCKDWRATDLAFLRAILESETEPVSDRMSCGTTPGPSGIREKPIAENGARSRTTLVKSAEDLCKLLAQREDPNYMVPLIPLASGDAAQKRRLQEAIVERYCARCTRARTALGSASRAPGRTTFVNGDLVRVRGMDTELLNGCIFEIRGPGERPDCWLAAKIGAETDAGVAIAPEKIELIVTCNERDRLMQE
ncbi:hypothetical protein BDK51DRAFT_39291 [Blyttiomyces helicus]|uniref:Uncharacterized protein n=1 Tax=Blyttiomyces helicus TaxID=388810 RepID=A0A4P9VYS6_9FUNG|nr:hypothetical protein BDK51DRAFT_39291 [Blyttiomyces helicus]|eukprot:RKO84432.1 hypothetical protein BDK51DRAFT_39291 [Blyttiomyces helicus]